MIEWRVCTKHHFGVNDEELADLKSALQWMALERADYPHAEVWIEQREVSPWTRVQEEVIADD